MTKFDDICLRCDVRKDPHKTQSRFCLSLKPKIQCVMLANSYNMIYVLDAYQLAQDLEISLRVPIREHSIAGEQPSYQFEGPAKPDTSTAQDPRGKSAIGELSQHSARGYKCYRCQGFDHFVAQCLIRNLLVEVALDEDNSSTRRFMTTRMAQVMPRRL